MVNNRVFTGNALNKQVIPLQDRDKVSLLYFVSGGWDG
jgi:sulfur carrier protein ThiS